MTFDPLSGYTIGVTADRRSDEQMLLLRGRGAECLHGPVVETQPLGTDSAMSDATVAMIDHPPDVVVVTTAVGVRGWLEACDALDLGGSLRGLLGCSDVLAGGSEAHAALVAAGLAATWTAPGARYDEIVAALGRRGVAGARVAVQLDGAGATQLCEQIEALGADVLKIPVYRWSLPADTAPAVRLLKAIIDRRVDAVTFTAKPAVDNFFALASELDLLAEVEEAIHDDVLVVRAGEVDSSEFTDRGYQPPPAAKRHGTGAMIQLIAARFAERGHDLRIGGVPVRVQGRMACVGGSDPVWLTDRERAVLEALIERPGAVNSKRDLLQRVWQGSESDEHLVEVTVARLRQRLGPAAAGIETVVRRGYRISES